MSVNTEPVERLAGEWEAEAELLRRRGAPHQAAALESAADDLRERIREWKVEPLTVAEAADESEYCERHLRELLSGERVPNVGEDGSPRIRRADLPAKPGGGGPTLEVSEGGKSIAERALERRRS